LRCHDDRLRLGVVGGGDNISDYGMPLSSALFKFSSVIFRTSEFLFGINRTHTFKILWWQSANGLSACLSVCSPLYLKQPLPRAEKIGKLQPSPRLIKHRAMKTRGRTEVKLHVFLTWRLHEDNDHLHAPAALPPGEMVAVHKEWGEGEQNIRCYPCRESNPYTMVVHQLPWPI
jgi:hypothetical protein